MTSSIVFATRTRAFAVLVGLLASLGPGTAAQADPISPSAADRQVTRAVAQLLARDHLSGRDLDDEISQRCLRTFLKSLDPWKLYFSQSDVDEFTKHQNDLDDMARQGDPRFAYEVFRVFLKRVDERVALVDELLAVDHDFTVDEQMVTDRDLARYAGAVAEARESWRKRVKYDLLVLKADGIEGHEARQKLRKRYQSFKERMHQTDGAELLEIYLTSLAAAFDPHSGYLSPASSENYEIATRRQLEGIGAALQSIDGQIVVKKIIPGGAADKDGRLKAEAKIVGVGQGRGGPLVSLEDMKLSQVVEMIRGERGTAVQLEVVPADGSRRKVLTITRGTVALRDSDARGAVFEKGQKAGGEPHKIGVIELPRLYSDMAAARQGLSDYTSATRDVRRILEGFKKKGVDAVVLDLRRAGGSPLEPTGEGGTGVLTEAISLSGLFVAHSPVVQVKDAGGRVRPYHSTDRAVAWEGPLVVLTSKFTAGGGEILAAAIQDCRRGLIVGDHVTAGRGTGQDLVNLGQELFALPNAPKLGALKITTKQFYRLGGDSIQQRGVSADVELPSLIAHLDIGEADLDYPLAFDRVEPLEFKRLDYVDQAGCDRLRQLSRQRCGGSEDFQEVVRDISRYKDQQKRRHVTLNEEQFLKQRAEMNADEARRVAIRAIEEIDQPDQPGVRRDYYLDEVLAIAADYLQLRKAARRD